MVAGEFRGVDAVESDLLCCAVPGESGEGVAVMHAGHVGGAVREGGKEENEEEDFHCL